MTRSGEPSVAELMAQLAANAAGIAALKAEKEALSARVVKLEEELELARLHRFAPKSEKHVDRLFDEAEQVADEDEASGEDGEVVDLPETGFATIEKPEGKKRGRKPLPEHLPRERVEYDLADGQKACPCCRHQMHRMGEAVTEQLHIEVRAKVLQNVRFKYACRHCDRTGINTPVVLAPMPAQPLPGSIATASTLAFALVHKYVDGTPLYRLAQAFERAGVPVSRGALGHWVIGSSERHLSRIYDALKLRLRSQPLIHGDETTVQVLKEKDREATSTSFMWAYRSGEDSGEPIVLLDYQPGRGQIYPQAFLGDYRGILMSDGYTAWRTTAQSTYDAWCNFGFELQIDPYWTPDCVGFRRRKSGAEDDMAMVVLDITARRETMQKLLIGFLTFFWPAAIHVNGVSFRQSRNLPALRNLLGAVIACDEAAIAPEGRSRDRRSSLWADAAGVRAIVDAANHRQRSREGRSHMLAAPASSGWL